MTSEFQHYQGCRHNDPDNCSACALTDQRQERPNYAGWPLSYMQNDRAVPAKWMRAFVEEFERTDNDLYVQNLHDTINKHGVRFEEPTPTTRAGFNLPSCIGMSRERDSVAAMICPYTGRYRLGTYKQEIWAEYNADMAMLEQQREAGYLTQGEYEHDAQATLDWFEREWNGEQP